MDTEVGTGRGPSGSSASEDDESSRVHRLAHAPLWAGVAVVLVALLVVVAVVLVTGGDDEPDGSQGPDPSVAAQKLSFAPPELEAPETIRVSSADTGFELDPDRDYQIVLPDEPLVAPGGLTLSGGRNVVLVGGRIEAEERGLYLVDQRGTVHVEGLSIGGDGLQEGINLSQPYGATVQLQNISIDMVTGEEDGHHADLIQSWAGPGRLLIDGFSGTTGYQGFFLLPYQFPAEPPVEWDFRRVAIRGDENAAYLLWTEPDAPWIRTSDVVVQTAEERRRDQVLWGQWDGVTVGDVADVRLPAGTPGVGYRSPGYVGS
ncbi:hypothetical protein [Blastococcus sp. SYSU D00695]